MQTVADALANLESSTSSPLLTELGEKFTKAGFEIALVGGPVRDAFLGRISPDLDFTTNAYPDDILKILKGWASNTWDVGREFGTIAATIDGQQVEITTYRADSYDKQTRKPTVEFGDDLESDLIAGTCVR
jgi:tRNA nucleotidyltransferase/poly(A) polymerase